MPEAKPKKFLIVASHPAYGNVSFTIPANDARDAFSTWKQFILFHGQWTIRRNDDLDANVVEVRS